jgi:hypothetical protein
MSPFDDIPGFEDDEPAPGATGSRPSGGKPAFKVIEGGGGEQPSTEQAKERPQAEEFQPIHFPALEGCEPPPREWIIDGWIPSGTVTSLYGAGGIGKSMIAQQMATCIATGVSLFGFNVPKHAPVVGIFTEDDDNELWRRQVRINSAVSMSMTGLRKLHLQGRAGRENTLVTYAVGKTPQLQPLVQTVIAACERYKPGLVILDNIAQLYGGDENDRHQVSHFCNVLIGIAQRFNCGVLLLGHPSKAEGSEYSGSTAWNNAVRSRLLLCRDKDGELHLMRPKANYAESDKLPLAWAGGVLRPTVGGDFLGGLDDAAKRQQEKHVEGVFLAALDRLAAINAVVSHSTAASNYAPKMMLSYGFAGDLKREALRDAMLRLIEREEVLTEQRVEKKANRGWKLGLSRPPSVASEPGEGQAEAAEADVGADSGTTARQDADGTWWREVGPDEVHQPGVHVRMNVTTGRSEVEISKAEAAAADPQGPEKEGAGD